MSDDIGSAGKVDRPLCLRADVWRTTAALIVLLAFWIALARTFWPEILPVLLRLAQSARGTDAARVESVHLDVRNNSSADQALLHRTISQLDLEYEAIQAFLNRESDYRIPVLITDGSGPALTDGVQLIVYHRDGIVNLDTAPFWLAILGEGDLSGSQLDLFVEGGFAVYVVEEIGRARPLLGQSANAWVALWRQQGTLLPLADAWTLDVPTNQREMGNALCALLEAGSFVRWVADTYGLETVQALRDGISLEEAAGLSLAEAEKGWLNAVATRELGPLPCQQAVPDSSFLHAFCDRLDAGASPASGRHNQH
jgi:hypothetical protein